MISHGNLFASIMQSVIIQKCAMAVQKVCLPSLPASRYFLFYVASGPSIHACFYSTPPILPLRRASWILLSLVSCSINDYYTFEMGHRRGTDPHSEVSAFNPYKLETTLTVNQVQDFEFDARPVVRSPDRTSPQRTQGRLEFGGSRTLWCCTLTS